MSDSLNDLLEAAALPGAPCHGDAYLELANADWQCEPLARG